MTTQRHSDIIITAPLPPFLYEPLKADYRCHDYVQATDKTAFLAGCGAVIRGLVQGGGTVTPTTLLDALPALEVISVFGVGYDGVPVDYCRSRGIKVTKTPDVLTDDVADVAVGLVLMTGRSFVHANRFVHAGEWQKRGAPLATKLAGKTAGILGLGRIGKAIAQRLSAMEMKIAYTGRKPQDVPYKFISDLKGLAAASDFLMLHARVARRPRTSSTPRCSARSARKARSSTSRAARSSTNRRLSQRCRQVSSRLPASTSLPTSPTFRLRS